MGSEHAITDSSRRGSWEGAGVYHTSVFRFTSSKMAEDLAMLGIVLQKTKVAAFHEPLFQPCKRGGLRYAPRGALRKDSSLIYEKRPESGELFGTERTPSSPNSNDTVLEITRPYRLEVHRRVA